MSYVCFYNIESDVYYFRNIYLGEIFSSYLCVHNGSNQVVKNVTVKVSLNYIVKFFLKILFDITSYFLTSYAFFRQIYKQVHK